ncbi:MAG: hypothetical protein GDA43_13235 [Hormoscilla sp. SP5CHS1]|nr:hypothetical protein [Hormoscilla sp. SP12CHS1]MBC6454034.1 hypothetical protein [Hormoscilla sp. SP5CHS1]MBC6471565.1 hypothetical protein [Hormoscilla sp. GM102CHS1]
MDKLLIAQRGAAIGVELTAPAAFPERKRSASTPEPTSTGGSARMAPDVAAKADFRGIWAERVAGIC